MNKEWLEEVKDTYQSVESLIELGDFKQADIAMCYLVENFGKWLIEQVERVKELEKVIGDLDENVAAFETLWLEEKRKNKRYKQALEFYADKKNHEREWDTFTDSGVEKSEVMKDGGEKARQALEGEK